MLEPLPWFESGKPLRNYMLHQTDFYDEVEQIWGRSWGAEGIGRLREVLVSRPTENEIRPEYAKEWQYYYSTPPAMPTSAVCRRSSTSTTTCSPATGCASTTSRRRCPRSASTATSRTWSRSPAQASVVRGGVILHRYGLGSWQRGREVIWSKALAALQVPIYHTIHGRGICEPGAGRWLDSSTFVFNESVVANEEGLRQLGFVLETLGVELVVAHSPGWYDSIGEGTMGTSHMDMVCSSPTSA